MSKTSVGCCEGRLLETACSNQPRPQEAERELERAVAIAPHMAKAHSQLARAYTALGLQDKAQQESERATGPWAVGSIIENRTILTIEGESYSIQPCLSPWLLAEGSSLCGLALALGPILRFASVGSRVGEKECLCLDKSRFLSFQPSADSAGP